MVSSGAKTEVSPDLVSTTRENAGGKTAEKPSILDRFRQWLHYEDENERRRCERRAVPGVTAYFWTGGVPRSYKLGNIGLTGMYLLTGERWAIETTVQMTLQKTEVFSEGAWPAVTVLVKVARWGEDGVGLEFVFADFLNQKGAAFLPGTNMKDLLHFMHDLNLPAVDK